MLLREAIRDLDALSLRATLFAELVDGHFSPASKVIALVLTDDDVSTPLREVAARRAPGMEYFLDVKIVRDALDGWRLIRLSEQVDADEATRVVIYYAENENWPAVSAG
jgi:hypothetical protein